MNDEYKVLLVRDNDPARIDEIWALLNANGIAPTPYESLAEARWCEDMNFCGCGIPDHVQAYVRRILAAMGERSESGWQTNNVDAVVRSDSDAILYFVLYTLDAMGLTEHGGGVGGSWLTDAGKKMLADLAA
jgi:hypothetical protein